MEHTVDLDELERLARLATSGNPKDQQRYFAAVLMAAPKLTAELRVLRACVIGMEAAHVDRGA